MAGWLLCCHIHEAFYKNEALFSETKIVTSVYSQSFDGTLDVEMINKVKFDGVPDEAIADLEIPSYENIIKLLLSIPMQ
jgi:starch synthase